MKGISTFLKRRMMHVFFFVRPQSRYFLVYFFKVLGGEVAYMKEFETALN